jgi:hypothetical protein
MTKTAIAKITGSFTPGELLGWEITSETGEVLDFKDYRLPSLSGDGEDVFFVTRLEVITNVFAELREMLAKSVVDGYEVELKMPVVTF